MEANPDYSNETAESLANKLREAILSGALPAGARVPSIRKLVAQGAGRGVAETALERLRAEGLIEARHGSGSYVRGFERIRRTSPKRLSKEQWGSGKAVQDADTGSRLRVVDVRVGDVVPPPDVADALGVGRDVEVLRRWRRFEVDGRSVQIAVSYLPTELTRGTRIEHTDTGPGGTPARLAELGYAPTRFSERLIARAAFPEEVAELRTRRSATVIEITRLMFAGQRCVEVTRMVLDAEAYELVYEFPA